MVSLLTQGRSRVLAVFAGLACASAFSLLVATTASAAPTLHFFSKQVTSTFSGPSGQRLSNNAPPAVGDSFDDTDLDYVGTHKHHAKNWTATDHIVCTFTAVNPKAMSGTATCNAQIAIGGSMLLAENVRLTFSNSNSAVVVPLAAGTGKFRGVHGRLKSVNVGTTNNSDLTITLTG